MASQFFINKPVQEGNRDIPSNVYIPYSTRQTPARKQSTQVVGEFQSTPPNNSLNLNDYLDFYYENNFNNGLTPYPTNILFVSKVTGTASPVKGDPNNAYLSPWLAAAAAADGDIIWVLDGTYTATNAGGGGDHTVTATASSQSLIPSTWLTGTYTFIFEKGTRVEDNSTVAQGSGHLFNITQPITVNVYGEGQFYKLRANGATQNRNYCLIKLLNNSANLFFQSELLQIDDGQVLDAQGVSNLLIDTSQIVWKGDFGVTLRNLSDANVFIKSEHVLVPKNLSGGTSYLQDSFRVRSCQNSKITFEFDNVEIYAMHAILRITSWDTQNLLNNVINFTINTLKVTNDSITAPVTNFGSLQVAATDGLNTTTVGTHLVWIRRTNFEFVGNEINIDIKSVSGTRLRPVEIDLGSAPTNNIFNINLNSYTTTNANGINISNFRGATNLIKIMGGVKTTTGALINCSDASFAGRLYLSGTWESNANSAIINTSGSGIVLTDFIGRGGSTASPITTSGAGDVAILSAAFNNITAITGTTSGATPLQDAGF